jgi:hypothetical protein
VTLHFGASLTYDTSNINYDHITFIIQATGFDKCDQKVLRETAATTSFKNNISASGRLLSTAQGQILSKMHVKNCSKLTGTILFEFLCNTEGATEMAYTLHTPVL